LLFLDKKNSCELLEFVFFHQKSFIIGPFSPKCFIIGTYRYLSQCEAFLPRSTDIFKGKNNVTVPVPTGEFLKQWKVAIYEIYPTVTLGDLLAGFGGVSAVDSSPQRTTTVSPGNPWDLSVLDPVPTSHPQVSSGNPWGLSVHTTGPCPNITASMLQF